MVKIKTALYSVSAERDYLGTWAETLKDVQKAECHFLKAERGQLVNLAAELVAARMQSQKLEEQLSASRAELTSAWGRAAESEHRFRVNEDKLTEVIQELAASKFAKRIRIDASQAAEVDRLTRGLDEERSKAAGLQVQLQAEQPRLTQENKELRDQVQKRPVASQTIKLPNLDCAKRRRSDSSLELNRALLKQPFPEDTMSHILKVVASVEPDRAQGRRLKRLTTTAMPEIWFCFQAAGVKDTWSKAGMAQSPCK
ncbi:hypothetical protein VTI74DRAFT_4078 [Chaetomium olivicolor]